MNLGAFGVRIRQATWLGATLAFALLLLAAPVQAAFPGKNGKIALSGGAIDCCGGGSIQIINPDGSDLQTLFFGRYPHWSPDGKRLLAAHGSFMTIVNADGTGQAVIGPQGSNPNWSPDGKQIVFGGQFGGIYVMNVDG